MNHLNVYCARLFLSAAPFHLALTALLMFSLPSQAQRTYSTAELQVMIAGGNYPKQVETASESWSMDYASCLASLQSVVKIAWPEYRTRSIVNTPAMRAERLWTNDGTVTIMCSAARKTITKTVAKYK